MPRIRPISICLFEKEGKLLVQEFWDEKRQIHYYRPPGGGIEFGETALEGLHREIKEELHEDITEAEQLFIIENFFPLNGEMKHELVFVFRAIFKDSNAYEKERFLIEEPRFDDTFAIWKPLKSFEQGHLKLYPKTLFEKMAKMEYA